MDGLQVRLLGGFTVEIDGRVVGEDGWRLRKAKTLVKLLVLAEGHRLHREQAIAVLWPDRAAAAAANNLHQVLHIARRQLDPGDAGARHLRLDDDVLTLRADGALSIDVDVFRQEAAAALRSGDRERARGALELYRGQLLPEDLYEEWTEPTRGELEHLRGELELLAGVDAVPGASAGARDNLPSELTTFIGREAELNEVARLMRRGPLLTLTGPAGCGKTRLALEAAARQRGGFRRGVWLVELASVARPELIADAVATATGVTPGGRSPRAALIESLAAREALIVLDNCEHLIAGCADLVEVLLRACSELRVLATSREPLHLTGEIVWRVPSLTLPARSAAAEPAQLMRSESVSLFVDRAAAARPGFALTADNAAAVVAICHRLDGMPLAIELAAARVAALPVDEIARRLGDSFRLLRQGRRTVQTRQQTLEAALDWSYHLLDANERTVLCRLGVFAGTFGLEAVEQVCGSEDPVEIIVRLVSKSLVVAEEAGGLPRFRLLEMVRQYAQERLAESGELDALRGRHALWYAGLPERLQASTGVEIRLRRLDLEPDNLRGALAWLLDHDPMAALRLAGSLGSWWLVRGRLVEGREWLESALERTPLAEVDREVNRGGYVAALARLARIQWLLNRGVEGVETAQRALALLPPGEEGTQERASLLAWLARTHVLRGRYRDGLTAGEEGLAAAVAAGDAEAEGEVRNTLGMAQIALGRVDEGVSSLRRSIEIANADGDPDRAAYAYGNLADHLNLRGRTVEALAIAKEGLAETPSRNRGRNTWLALTVSELYFETGDWEAARAYLGPSRSRLQGTVLIFRLLREAELALAEGDEQLAARALKEAELLVAVSTEPQWIGVLGALLGELRRRRGDLLGARDAVAQAVNRLEVYTDDVMRIAQVSAVGVRVEADIAQQARDLRESTRDRDAIKRARLHTHRLRAAASEGGPVEGAWRTMGTADLARARGQDDPALWLGAASEWERITRPYPAALARWRAAAAYVDRGDRPAAATSARASLASARKLGSRWLADELEVLAERATLELD